MLQEARGELCLPQRPGEQVNSALLLFHAARHRGAHPSPGHLTCSYATGHGEQVAAALVRTDAQASFGAYSTRSAGQPAVTARARKARYIPPPQHRLHEGVTRPGGALFAFATPRSVIPRKVTLMLTLSIQRPLPCLTVSAHDVPQLHARYGWAFAVTDQGQVRSWRGFTAHRAADTLDSCDAAARPLDGSAAQPDLAGCDPLLDRCVTEFLRFAPNGGRFAVGNLYLRVIHGPREENFAQLRVHAWTRDPGEHVLLSKAPHQTPVAVLSAPARTVASRADQGTRTRRAATKGAKRGDGGALSERQRQELQALRLTLTASAPRTG